MFDCSQLPAFLPRTDRLRQMLLDGGIPHALRVHIWPRLLPAQANLQRSHAPPGSSSSAKGAGAGAGSAGGGGPGSDASASVSASAGVPETPTPPYPDLVRLAEFAIAEGGEHSVEQLNAMQIERDLLRTLPANVCFARPGATGIGRLRRVLRAVSWLYPEIGYCQGTGVVRCVALVLTLTLTLTHTHWWHASLRFLTRIV